MIPEYEMLAAFQPRQDWLDRFSEIPIRLFSIRSHRIHYLLHLNVIIGAQNVANFRLPTVSYCPFRI